LQSMNDRRLLFCLAISITITAPAFAQQKTIGVLNKSALDSSYFFISNKLKGGYLLTTDEHDFYEFTRESRFLKLFKNGVLLDTLQENGFTFDLGYARNIQKKGNTFFLVGRSEAVAGTVKYSIHEYSLPTNKIVKRAEATDFIYALGDKFFTSTNGTSLSEFAENFKLSTLVELAPLLKPDARIAQVNRFPNTNILLIMTGQGSGDAYENEQYFTIDLLAKKITEVTDLIMSKCTQVKDDLNTYNFLIDQDRSDYFDGELLLFRRACVEFKQPVRLDVSLTNRGRVIQRQGAIKGYIIREEKPAGYLASSVTDKNETVMITEITDTSLEEAFVKIMDNVLLQAKDIKRLSSMDLHLLKHFVLAKHNARFDERFLQAYFNQFTFYRLQNRKRVANAEALLTEQDKKNLLLIDKAIAR
jgi:hypothetical protein